MCQTKNLAGKWATDHSRGWRDTSMPLQCSIILVGGVPYNEFDSKYSYPNRAKDGSTTLAIDYKQNGFTIPLPVPEVHVRDTLLAVVRVSG